MTNCYLGWAPPRKFQQFEYAQRRNPEVAGSQTNARKHCSPFKNPFEDFALTLTLPSFSSFF